MNLIKFQFYNSRFSHVFVVCVYKLMTAYHEQRGISKEEKNVSHDTLRPRKNRKKENAIQRKVNSLGIQKKSIIFHYDKQLFPNNYGIIVNLSAVGKNESCHHQVAFLAIQTQILKVFTLCQVLCQTLPHVISLISHKYIYRKRNCQLLSYKKTDAQRSQFTCAQWHSLNWQLWDSHMDPWISSDLTDRC